MHRHNHRQDPNRPPGGGRQRGALTLFSAVLILILMSLMLFYASRVGLLETRVSANDLRVKQAFSAAESAVDYGIKFTFANAPRLLSASEDKFPDGLGGLTGDGWFSAADTRWEQCPDMSAWTQDAIRAHPCGGDFPMSDNAYYWETDGDTGTIESVVATNSIAGLPNGVTARLTMVICFVDLSNPAGGCSGNPATSEDEYGASLVLWLLGYGYSDCTDVNNVATCLGAATVARPVSNFRALQGSASVPLVAKSAVPAGGTMEVVGNPNASGVGVTATTWVNSNHAECPPLDPNGNVMAEGEEITDFGTWQTCELQEWYHVAEYPDGVTCIDNNCQCGYGGNPEEDFLSWKISQSTNIDFDIIVDDDFPCDLFEFFFGVPRTNYWEIMSAAQIMSDCSGLGPTSQGLIWVTGSCEIRSNTSVGSPDTPVILITAGPSTTINGGAIFYGLFFAFDYVQEQSGGTNLVQTKGSATVYGVAVMDAPLDQIQGTFQVVFADGVSAAAAGISGIGSVNGGWRDFGLPDIAW